MTNGLFLSENQRKKMGAAVPLCPEMVEIFQSSGCRPQLSLLGLPGWSIFFFLIIFVIFFILSPRSQWTESKSKQQGRSPDKTKMTPGAAPNLDRIKVWSPAWEEINDYLFIESSLHWPKLKTFMRSSWNVNCESWLKIDAVFRRQ